MYTYSHYKLRFLKILYPVILYNIKSQLYLTGILGTTLIIIFARLSFKT